MDNLQPGNAEIPEDFVDYWEQKSDEENLTVTISY